MPTALPISGVKESRGMYILLLFAGLALSKSTARASKKRVSTIE
jgi:hypothetical protein